MNSQDLIVAVQPFNEMPFSQFWYVIWYILYTSVLCLSIIVFNQYQIIFNLQLTFSGYLSNSPYMIYGLGSCISF